MVERYGVYYHSFMKHFHVDTAGGCPMFCKRKTTPQLYIYLYMMNDDTMHCLDQLSSTFIVLTCPLTEHTPFP